MILKGFFSHLPPLFTIGPWVTKIAVAEAARAMDKMPIKNKIHQTFLTDKIATRVGLLSETK